MAVGVYERKKKDYSNGKRCGRCKKIKPLSEYYKRENRTTPLSWCIVCTRAKRSEYGRKHYNYDRERNRKFRRIYGLTLEDYEHKYRAQNGECAICGKHKKVLHIDHNHKTNKVRDLLCRVCNCRLSFFEDFDSKPFRLYLEKHNGEGV